jgi:hypothetical protein
MVWQSVIGSSIRDGGILDQHNPALRTNWFDRALVIEEFKDFVEL